MLSPRHPVWMCALRPFFLFSVVSAPAFILLWVAFLALGLPLPVTVGGPFVWHAHELIFGFTLAAVAGFALTAIPEFTATAGYAVRPLQWLAGLWLLGRVAFWSSGLLGPAAIACSALAHLGFLLFLLWLLVPRLWSDPAREHLSFVWATFGLTACVAGFYVDTLGGEHPARWLYAAVGLLMILIIVAMSRISMRIVNRALEIAGETGTEYRARPPRRNLAILCIGLYTLAEFAAPGTRLAGWLALATAAALFNLMGDWHIGRVLLRRWVLMLYGVYVLMAAGYALMGSSLVWETGLFSAGRHLLTIGAIGLSIYVVICIAGLTHCGHEFDERFWVPVGAAMIVVSAVLRAFDLWSAAGMLWSAAFALVAVMMVPIFISPRRDGLWGCDGPPEAVEAC